jgi:hypothetical protein|tara:strand:+ start:46 stop:237 length:192 start_codon:yes stop_codon:yes gene_type:complete
MKDQNYRSDRYPTGYQPKIEYYQAKLALAVDALDIDKIKFLTGKLEYFLDRHAAINGRLESIS